MSFLRGTGVARAAVVSLALAVLPGQAAPPRAAGPQPLTVTARPIAHFATGNAERRRFGALEFRGGLVLASSDPDFGGWSGLWRSPDGSHLVAVSDKAHWLTATPTYAGGKLSGLAEATIAPVLSAAGTPLARTRAYDTEALTIVGGTAYVTVERAHQVLSFAFGRDNVMARARPVPAPPALRELTSNKGLEGIGMVPKGPFAGALVAIAERSGGLDEPTKGFILTGKARGSFQVTRSNAFDVTDLAFLPGGDMLVLERFYQPLRGVAMRIRRIDGGTIRPGATLDGRVVIEADLGHEIDNMEGLAVHRNAAGETIVTIVSDDNFSMIQRTLLLEFAFVGE